MTINFHGRTALITGAARGLGLLLSEKLAAEAVNICGTDIRGDLLQLEMARIKDEYSIETMAMPADIAQEDEIINVVQHVMDNWGRIDMLINNAGIRKVGLVNEVDEETWDEIHATNLKGQFLCSREVLRQDMLRRNEGTIIFISSDAGKAGSGNSSAYAASKWGGLGFAASLAKDLKTTSIRISTVIPGRMWTPMAQESEASDMDIDWLDPAYVADAVMYCIRQKVDTIIPELQIFHRSQL